MVGIGGAAEFVSFSPPLPILTPQVVLWDSAQRKDTWFDWVCCGAEGQSPYLSPRSLGGTSLTTVCESMFYITWRQKMPILVWVFPKAGPDVRTWVTPRRKNKECGKWIGDQFGTPPVALLRSLGEHTSEPSPVEWCGQAICALTLLSHGVNGCSSLSIALPGC